MNAQVEDGLGIFVWRVVVPTALATGLACP